MFERSSSYTGVIYNDSSSMAFWVLLILKKRMPPSLEGSVPWLVSSPGTGPDTGCESGAPAGPAWLISSWRCSRWILYALCMPLQQVRKNTISRHTRAAQAMPSMDGPTLEVMPASENLFLTITETAVWHETPAAQKRTLRDTKKMTTCFMVHQQSWNSISIGDKVLGQRGGVSKVVVRRNRLVRTQVCAVSVGVGVVGLWVADSPKGPSGNVSVGIQVGGSGLDPVKLVEREGRDRAGEDNEQQEQGSTGQQQQSEQSVKRSEQHGN
ncbi:hypothetical protein KL939_005087 [Ogataea angusta]|nr:hypothetical protein KL939_005087 [Ogataea angusta]